jgi:rare lipoprotein A
MLVNPALRSLCLNYRMKYYRIIGIIILNLILVACSSAPDEVVTRAPFFNNPDVAASKPRPPRDTPAVGQCIATNGKVGRSYTIRGVRYTPKRDANYSARGIASYYGKNHHGKQTANGERFNMNALSAAHTTLPLPSCVKVTNLKNNKSIILRVNDRGPFIKGRIIDVSYAAAKELDFIGSGIVEVHVKAFNGTP